MGYDDDQGTLFSTNHHEIWVEYHEVSGNENQPASSALGAAEPRSKKYTRRGRLWRQLYPDHRRPDQEESPTSRSATARLVKSPTAWATRWTRFHVFDFKIHWFWLIDTAIIAVILVLTVDDHSCPCRRRISSEALLTVRSDQPGRPEWYRVDLDGVQEDFAGSWCTAMAPASCLCLVIFRPCWKWCSAFCQRTGFTILFALFGFFRLQTVALFGTIMIISVHSPWIRRRVRSPQGHASARQGEQWKLNIALTPVLDRLPGIVFCRLFSGPFPSGRSSPRSCPFHDSSLGNCGNLVRHLHSLYLFAELLAGFP